MIDYDKWQEIFNSIRRHKLRTALTAFGVFWGIFMLVLLLGAGKGLQKGVEYDFRDDAINSIWMYRGTTSKPFDGLKEGRRIRFDNEDYNFLERQFSQIDELTGRFYLSSDQIVKYKDKALSFNTRSVHPGHKVLENTIVTKGRFLTDKDNEEFNKVAVIGKIVKENLFGEEEAVGKQIKIGKIVYTIIGEYRDTGGENEMRTIYIPIRTAQKVYSGGNTIHQLMFTVGDLTIDQMNALESKIRYAFAARKRFDPEDKRALFMYNRAEEYQELLNLFAVINGIVWLVGIFSIIAGVIGVSNIMLIIVKDRTREIGIRKAIGATPGSIISMILQESIFITGVAGYLGVIGGTAFIFALSGVESDFFRHPEVNIMVIILATIILVIAGTLAGLIPAMQAANINPVEAMKSD